MRLIHGEEINGVSVDAQTRCAHYKTELDVIAIKFKCCQRWFPCIECHHECADHSVERWAAAEGSERAILCGACGHQQTMAEYLDGNSICPVCNANFNPACSKHYHLYFES